jgi:hypothetical protein
LQAQAELLGVAAKPAAPTASPQRCEAAILKVNDRSVRARMLGESEQLTFRSRDMWTAVPGQIASGSEPTTVVADSGVENVNGVVDALLGLGQLRRVLAQVEVTCSDSMIEAWWRSLKHRWLYLHQLESFVTLEKLIAFYVEQHNSVAPHSAFAGQTPDEMYFERGAQIPVNLAAARTRAREARMKANRSLSCTVCQLPLSAPAAPPDSFAISDRLQLQREKLEPQLGIAGARSRWRRRALPDVARARESAGGFGNPSRVPIKI